MADNNMDKLKKIIEEKKRKSQGIDTNVRPDRTLGKSQKAFDNKKSGGSSNNKV